MQRNPSQEAFIFVVAVHDLANLDRGQAGADSMVEDCAGSHGEFSSSDPIGLYGGCDGQPIDHHCASYRKNP